MENNLTMKDILQTTDIMRFVREMSVIARINFSNESDCTFKVNDILSQTVTLKSFMVLLQTIFNVDDYMDILRYNNINDKDVAVKLEKVNNKDDIDEMTNIVKIRFIEENSGFFIDDYKEQFLETEYFNSYIKEILNTLIKALHFKFSGKEYGFTDMINNHIMYLMYKGMWDNQ